MTSSLILGFWTVTILFGVFCSSIVLDEFWGSFFYWKTNSRLFFKRISSLGPNQDKLNSAMFELSLLGFDFDICFIDPGIEVVSDFFNFYPSVFKIVNIYFVTWKRAG